MAGGDKDPSRLPEQLPPAVADVARQLRQHGHSVWIVGGAVRDALLGRASRDFDLATSAGPNQLAALFPQAAVFDARLGAMRLDTAAHSVSINSLRVEGDYRDRRHPNTVRFVDDPLADADRRDFTVNAIYVELPSGAVVDPYAGRADLQRRLLRVIGDADRRLAEDPLRLLRAVRFAASADLQIDAATGAALARHATAVRTVSAERTFAELTLAFTGHNRGRALRVLVASGLGAVVLPEVVAMDGIPQPPEYHPEGDVLTHVCLVLDHVTAGDPVQAWAAVLHDIGKPPTFARAEDRIRFSGHDLLSATMAITVLNRLHAPAALRELVADICRQHIRFAVLPQMTPGKRERWLRSPQFAAHLDFHRADCMGSHGDLRIWQQASAWLAALPPEPPPPLCLGRDVTALGVAAGPMVGEVLREVRARLDALDRPDRDTALSIVKTVVAELVKSGAVRVDNRDATSGPIRP